MLPPGVTSEPNVALNDSMLRFLGVMRSKTDPSVPMHLTSGIRSVGSQASAMWVKFQADPSGNGLVSLYGQKAVNVVQAAKTAGVNGIAQHLTALASQGVVFSKHMVGDAFDLRTTNLSTAQIGALRAGAIAAGAGSDDAIVESTPPHLHVEGLTGFSLANYVPSTETVKKNIPTLLLMVLGSVVVGGLIYWSRRRSGSTVVAGSSVAASSDAD